MEEENYSHPTYFGFTDIKVLLEGRRVYQSARTGSYCFVDSKGEVEPLSTKEINQVQSEIEKLAIA